MLLLGASSLPVLYLACAMGGLAYGAYWALLPTLVAELFGVAHLASIYNTLTLAVTSSSLLIATLLASTIYDSHVVPPAKQCYGDECYHLTHLIVAGICAVGVLATELLAVRTRVFYSGIAERALSRAVVTPQGAS